MAGASSRAIAGQPPGTGSSSVPRSPASQGHAFMAASTRTGAAAAAIGSATWSAFIFFLLYWRVSGAAHDRNITHATRARRLRFRRGRAVRIREKRPEKSALEECAIQHVARLLLEPGEREGQHELEEHEDEDGRDVEAADGRDHPAHRLHEGVGERGEE